MSDERAIAAAYDDINQRFALPFVDDMANKPYDRALCERFAALCAGGAVVDAGCGTGKIARFLYDRGVHEVRGVDLSATAIEQARAMHPAIPFAVGSLLDLGAEDASLAGVAAFFSLIHLDRADARRAVDGFRRALRPGGHLLLSVYEGEGEQAWEQAAGSPVDIVSTLFAEAELREWLEAAGLDVVEAHTRGPYRYEFDTPRLFVLAQKRVP